MTYEQRDRRQPLGGPVTPVAFTNLDEALVGASVVCHASGRAVIYYSTHPDVADPGTGELYLVFPGNSADRRHLRDDQGWRAAYTVSEGDL